VSVHGIDREAIAALNDIVAELVCGLATGEAITRGWAFDAVKTIEENQRELGFLPHVTSEQIAEWEGLVEEL
jgi:hypothetical protein